MDSSVFDRETLLDTTVNLIPIGMMAFFIAMFAIYFPWTSGPLIRAISVIQIAIPLAFLALITYLAAKRI